MDANTPPGLTPGISNMKWFGQINIYKQFEMTNV